MSHYFNPLLRSIVFRLVGLLFFAVEDDVTIRFTVFSRLTIFTDEKNVFLVIFLLHFPLTFLDVK